MNLVEPQHQQSYRPSSHHYNNKKDNYHHGNNNYSGNKTNRRHPHNNQNSPNRHHRRPPGKPYWKKERQMTAKKESANLMNYLRQHQWLPTKKSADEKCRATALKLLEKVMCQWLASLQSLRPTKNQNKWQRLRVTLVPFGSSRLKAHRADSDLDVLCLCPEICSRSDFFSSLPVLFEATPAIGDIYPIPGAYTPVIKMAIHGIAVDLLFGRVAGDQSRLLEFQQRSPSPLLATSSSLDNQQQAEYYIIQDLDLLGVDESMMRSLNGVRVTQYILDVVPDLHSFRVLLCAVKEWATVNGIYSNSLGFLGGINFAILCAWICKRYPRLRPSSLLLMFFRTFATWEWSKPVTLCEIQQLPPTGVPKMPAWNPETNPRDARHLMPIITPIYPSMNSSYNVGIPQQRRINEELCKAVLLMDRNEKNWRSVFEKSDFFERHANYLQITIRAGNASDFIKWHRLIESRLRILLSALEDAPEVCIYPFAQFMKRDFAPEAASDSSSQASSEDCAQEALFFIGLRFTAEVETLNLKQYSSEFLYSHINSWEGRKPGMDFLISHRLQQDLPFDIIEQYLETETATVASTQEASYNSTDDDSSFGQDNASSVGIAEFDISGHSDDDVSAMMPMLKRQRSGTTDKTAVDATDE